MCYHDLFNGAVFKILAFYWNSFCMLLIYFISIHFFSFQLLEIFTGKYLYNDWIFANHWRESVELQIVNKKRNLFQTQLNTLKWKIYWINVNFYLLLEISTHFLIFQSEMNRKWKVINILQLLEKIYSFFFWSFLHQSR
jgi:hypothetical protein